MSTAHERLQVWMEKAKNPASVPKNRLYLKSWAGGKDEWTPNHREAKSLPSAKEARGAAVAHEGAMAHKVGSRHVISKPAMEVSKSSYDRLNDWLEKSRECKAKRKKKLKKDTPPSGGAPALDPAGSSTVANYFRKR